MDLVKLFVLLFQIYVMRYCFPFCLFDFCHFDQYKELIFFFFFSDPVSVLSVSQKAKKMFSRANASILELIFIVSKILVYKFLKHFLVVYLEPSWTSTMELFYENNWWLKAVNCLRKKAPLWILNGLLNTPLCLLVPLIFFSKYLHNL